MDQTHIIKKTAGLYAITLALYLVLSFWLDSYLPESLQAYLEASALQEPTTLEMTTYVFILIVLLVHLFSVAGLIQGKTEAKNQFVYTMLMMVILSPVVGPHVEHGLSAGVGGLATMISGALVALLYFTESVFKQSKAEAHLES